MATHENHKHASDMWYGTQAICSADVLHRFAKALTDEGDKALARQYMAYAATLEQALQLLHDPDPKIRAAMGFYRSGYKDDPSERARWEATLHGGTYRCGIIWPNFQEAPKTVIAVTRHSQVGRERAMPS